MRTRTVQNSFLSGVLDERAAGRVETDAYNNGMLVGDNVTVHHLGGVRRRAGLEFKRQLPNTLTFLTPDSATTPNGGTAANAYDQDESTLVTTTTGASTTNPYVVVRYDMGSAVSVSHADVKNLTLSTGSSDDFRIQYSENDSTWFDFGQLGVGSVKNFTQVDTDARSYRRNIFNDFGITPFEARYWRVVKTGGDDLGAATVSLAEFNLWTETSTVSEVRLFSFETTVDKRYLVAVTDRSATFFLNGDVIPQGSIPLPYASADIPELDAVVGADSLFIVHEDYAPRFVVDEFDGDDFQTGEIVFDNIPQYDYDDPDSPTPTSEIQVITFDANWNQGDTFQIELDGARTGLVSYAGDATAAERTTTASNIAREVQKLFSVPGFTGVSCARTGALAYTVTFANASAKTYDGLMNVTPGTVLTSTASATIARSQAGVPRSEDVWSSARGYPRTVTFFEGRLYFGGTRSRLQSLFGSAVNDILNFELAEQLDADPIFVTLNGQQLNAITGIFSGRTLELFTTGGEFRYVKRQGDPIVPGDTPKQQTQNGTKRIRPVSIDGASIFIQRLGKSVRDFRFDFEQDAYNSLGLSSLAPALINGAVDIAAWQGSSTDEINLVYVVNGDGTVAVLNLRKEADVRAWTRWFTGPDAVVASDRTVSGQDEFKAVATTVEEVFFAVKRDIDGTEKLFVELQNDDFYVDSGVNITDGLSLQANHLLPVFGTASSPVRIRAQVDHIVLADQPVDGDGGVDVDEPEYVDAAIQIGLNFNPTVTPMPLASMTPVGNNFLQKRRVVKARAKVRNTLGLLMNNRPLPDRSYDIADFDTAPTPFTGVHALEETSNYDETEDKLITFSQVDPLPMEILAISVDLEGAA